MTEIIVTPVVTTVGNENIQKEGENLNIQLRSLLAEGYKVTHLASAEFNGALYNTYVLEKE